VEALQKDKNGLTVEYEASAAEDKAAAKAGAVEPPQAAAAVAALAQPRPLAEGVAPVAVA
jgi:hypothetical protein